MNIQTEHISPPIPIRSHDWRAWDADDDPETGFSGWGSTEVEAINDLMLWKEELTFSTEGFPSQPEPKNLHLAP